MSNETEQDNQKYTECRHCGKFSVHHFNSKSLWVIGDEEDAQGGISEFDGVEIETDASVFAHICTNPDCEEMQDIGIEDPQELDFARQEAKLLIKQLLTGTLPPELSHSWDGIIHHEGLTASICTKCELISDRPRFAFKVGDKLEYIAAGVAPPCSGKFNLAWWDSESKAETSG